MGFSVKIEGLNPQKSFNRIFDNDTRVFIHKTAANLMNDFVPMQTGILASSTRVTKDYVEYTQPYAKYLYYGKLMLSKDGSPWANKGERKYPTSKSLKYSTEGHLLATSHWDKAMMKSKGDEFARTVQAELDRK